MKKTHENHRNAKRTDFSFARYFNPWKNRTYEWPEFSASYLKKRRGILVWNSYHKGTYRRS